MNRADLLTDSFEFERDFAGSLRCIPMVVRFKLDLCGIKLSLRQWSKLLRLDRHWLLRHPCATRADAVALRTSLAEIIGRLPGETVQYVEMETDPRWRADRVPDVIVAQSIAVGAPPPSRAEWAALSDLQRFSLVKLTRAGRENANFLPAMREFGLALRETAAAP